MNPKALKTLEYEKIILQLTEYAASEPGKALCRSLIPSSNYDEIVRSQQETTDASARVRMKGSLSLSGVKNITDSIKRLGIGSALGITELLSISSLLTVAARAKSYGRHDESNGRRNESYGHNDESNNRRNGPNDRNDGPNSRRNGPNDRNDGPSIIPDDSLDEMFRLLEPLTPVNTEIKRCIISEEEISSDASPGLRHVRRSMRLIGDRIHSQLNALLNSNRNYLQDAVITMRDGRYCLPVKSEHKNQVAGMVHDQSATGSTLFIEPMAIIKLNNDLRELEIQEQKEIEAILADLSTQLATYQEELTVNQEILTNLDFIFAKAALSRHYRGTQPRFNQEGRIHIKDGRHPLLDPAKVVPITIWLGNGFDLLIVTGPNTGGKTVSLKTVGLFTLMGQSGLHIPAFEGSELAVFEEVFADIGDEQSIEQSLSTFSAHMTNIVHILGHADPKSLCLFDELGAGTDPTEGAALAIAVLTFLHNMQCRTMATTHYSELKVFALSIPGVENASCEFSVETLQPTYRLLIGIPGKSNAFAISKKLGLPDFIIDDAKTHLASEDETFEDLIAHLEESRTTIENERAQIQAYKEEISRLKARLELKEERLDERKDKLIRSANEEAQKILRDAKETADQTIKNINRLAAASGVNKELEAERKRLREKLNHVDQSLAIKQTAKPQGTLNPKTLKIGDGVTVLSMNLKGTVSTLPDAKGNLYVQMGIFRSQVNIKDLELLQEHSVSSSALNNHKGGTGAGKIKMSKSFSIATEINLIGKTVDEAIPVMDKYLDDAYLAHLPQVRIVHGRGTGALRAGVHKHLKRLKYVKEFHLGEYGEGDTGVTIVIFK